MGLVRWDWFDGTKMKSGLLFTWLEERDRHPRVSLRSAGKHCRRRHGCCHQGLQAVRLLSARWYDPSAMDNWAAESFPSLACWVMVPTFVVP